jgi:hypothetical protein
MLHYIISFKKSFCSNVLTGRSTVHYSQYQQQYTRNETLIHSRWNDWSVRMDRPFCERSEHHNGFISGMSERSG